jgi:Transcription factor WhiB
VQAARKYVYYHPGGRLKAFVQATARHRLGACGVENPEIFFPSNGDPGTKARQVCAACPVRRECLQYAMEADELGIWGGMHRQQAEPEEEAAPQEHGRRRPHRYSKGGGLNREQRRLRAQAFQRRFVARRSK